MEPEQITQGAVEESGVKLTPAPVPKRRLIVALIILMIFFGFSSFFLKDVNISFMELVTLEYPDSRYAYSLWGSVYFVANPCWQSPCREFNKLEGVRSSDFTPMSGDSVFLGKSSDNLYYGAEIIPFEGDIKSVHLAKRWGYNDNYFFDNKTIFYYQNKSPVLTIPRLVDEKGFRRVHRSKISRSINLIPEGDYMLSDKRVFVNGREMPGLNPVLFDTKKVTDPSWFVQNKLYFDIPHIISFPEKRGQDIFIEDTDFYINPTFINVYDKKEYHYFSFKVGERSRASVERTAFVGQPAMSDVLPSSTNIFPYAVTLNSISSSSVSIIIHNRLKSVSMISELIESKEKGTEEELQTGNTLSLYEDRELGISFEYPSEWGEVTIGNEKGNCVQNYSIDDCNFRTLLFKDLNSSGVFFSAETVGHHENPVARGGFWGDTAGLINPNYLVACEQGQNCVKYKNSNEVFFALYEADPPPAEIGYMPERYLVYTDNNQYYGMILSSRRIDSYAPEIGQLFKETVVDSFRFIQ